MNKQPLVSILMNCYNCEKYLKEAVDSIYAQSFQDWEIVFVDNCSTDNTKKIVESYDSKIKYHKTPSVLPLGAARNYGLQYCRAKYIAFLDTDDIWLEHKLEVQIKALNEHPEFQLCYGGVICIDEDAQEIGKMIPRGISGDVFAQQLKKYEINMQSVVLRNGKHVKFNAQLRHSPDFDLFISLVSSSKAYVIKDFIVKYRKHANSLTSKNIDVWWIEMKKTLDELFAKNPSLKDKYPHEYKLAYAKVAYYKARYLISINNKTEATKELSRFKFTSVIYFSIYVASLFPSSVWNFIHRNR